MTKPTFTVTQIAQSLEFGHGSISGQDAEAEVLEMVHEIIYRSPHILVEVDRDNDGQMIDDDGCGDGRHVVAIFQGDKNYKRSLNRPKVFGGAVAMTAGATIGFGLARNVRLNDVFDMSIDALLANKINFGAHTDEHACGNNCGCGAIDKAEEAIFAAARYEAPIRNVIEALGVETGGLDAVFDNYRVYIKELAEQQAPYSGQLVYERIVREGKVIKRLGGEHRERGIILNTVQGYTPNQRLVREITDDRAQAFAVDLWRLKEIANKLFPEQAGHQNQAKLGMLVYTLATAAVLTKGDLPVYMTQEQPAPVAV